MFGGMLLINRIPGEITVSILNIVENQVRDGTPTLAIVMNISSLPCNFSAEVVCTENGVHE